MRLQQRMTVKVCGVDTAMVCTMGSLFDFEIRVGRPVYELVGGVRPAVIRTLIWSLLEDRDRISVDQVGRMSIAEAAAAIRAAGLLLQIASPAPDPDPPDDDEQTEGEDEQIDWLSMWSAARADLGMSEQEFWSLSPAMYAALADRLTRRLYGHCITAAAITNCHIDPTKSQPATAMIFMPGRYGRREARRMKIAQGEALRAKMGLLRAVLPGVEVKP